MIERWFLTYKIDFNDQTQIDVIYYQYSTTRTEDFESCVLSKYIFRLVCCRPDESDSDIACFCYFFVR